MSLWLKPSHVTMTLRPSATSSPSTGLQAHKRPHWAYNSPGTFPPPLCVHAKYFPWHLHGLLRYVIKAWIKCHSFRGVSADHPSWNSPRCPLLTPHSASLASTAFITTWHHVNYPFMVCFSYLEADEGRYFVLFDAISLTPRALTALNTCLCTQAYQHPHLHREKLRGKTEMGLKSAPLSF